MNLHDVRLSFETRVASIEKETSYLLGKLALVSEAQKIAAQIGGASSVSPEVSGESTGSFSQTVTALPLSEPAAPAPVEARMAEPVVEVAPAPKPAVSATPAAPVEEPASYSNVAQFVPTPAPAAKAEPEPEPEVDEIETEAPAAKAEPEPQEMTATVAPAAEVVAEEPEAAVEEAEVVAEDVDATVEEPSLDVRVDQVLAEFEQEAIAQTSRQPLIEAEELADEVELAEAQADAEAEVEAEASEDSSENTAELEKLEMTEAVEAEAEEAIEAEPVAKPDALASLREKLASAAAEEPPKSPFLTLGKFLNRAK